MRWWQKTLLTGLVLMLLALAGAYWYVQKTLAALPLQNLNYTVKTISLHQLQLGDISFSLNTPATIHVQLSKLSISWQFPALLSPALDRIQLDGGTVTLTEWPQADNTADDKATTPLTLPANWQLPAMLPADVTLQQLVFNLPCGQNRCSYQLAAQVNISRQQLQYQLHIADTASAEIPRLTLNGSYQTVQQLPLLNMQLNLADNVQLTLSQQLSQHNGLNASGELSLDIAPPSPWLLQQFKQWQLELPPDALAQFTAPLTLHSNWQLALPAQLDLAGISQNASGAWQLTANLPTPLTIPGLGRLQGTVAAELGLQQGELSRYRLDSQLTLLQPRLPDALLQLGANADAIHISLTADGKNPPQLTALPLHIALQSEGNSALSINTDVMLNLTPPISAQLQQAGLTLKQQQLTPAADTRLAGIELNSKFTAYWLADSWQLDVHHLDTRIATLTAPDTQAHDLQLTVAAGRFSGDSSFSRIKLKSDITLHVNQLTHPQLTSQSWQGQGTLNGDLGSGELTALALAGRLGNAASLGLAYQLHYQSGQQPDTLQLNWQLDDMFLLAGNPLAATLSAWPQLLEFNRGRLGGSGELQLLPAMMLQANVGLSGISGIYDRSLFKDLSSSLQLSYQDDTLQLATTDASLAEIQHGIIAGPLKLSAHYTAAADNITAGKLDLRQLQLLAMGGQVQVQPVLLDLALQEQEVLLQLKQIDLTQLLQQHPTTDLTGNGRISGTIPLLLGRAGASVKDGNIAAESPGGKLQYRPAAAQSMAAGNPGMQMVLEALDDFHYSVLSSNVSYDTTGKLLLALSLQGKNPALEAGRAINLNINLEEDIPALLTSLQLSSQISDKIKQRVQQRLQQQGARGANGVQP